MNAAITAKTTEGSMFATRSFLPHTRFTPTQKIKIEPIIDKFERASCVIIGLTNLASNVIEPWKIPTGIAEKIQPFPIAHVITIIMIKSRTALVASMEKSPARMAAQLMIVPKPIMIKTHFHAKMFVS